MLFASSVNSEFFIFEFFFTSFYTITMKKSNDHSAYTSPRLLLSVLYNRLVNTLPGTSLPLPLLKLAHVYCTNVQSPLPKETDLCHFFGLGDKRRGGRGGDGRKTVRVAKDIFVEMWIMMGDEGLGRLKDFVR